MSPADIGAAIAAAGLKGWKGTIKPLDEARGVVALVWSPDYCPGHQTGTMKAARAEASEAALSAAIDAARQSEGLLH